MYYSFGPETPGWKQERSRELAKELTVLLEKVPLQTDWPGKRCPYIEVIEATGNQIFIRHLTGLPQVECPVFSEPVGMIETGRKGAEDGTRKEAFT